jgi:hypothetical protein
MRGVQRQLVRLVTADMDASATPDAVSAGAFALCVCVCVAIQLLRSCCSRSRCCACGLVVFRDV